MESYIEVSTLSDHSLTAKVCDSLEGAGIPVMTEHVEVINGNLRSAGFRILVPIQYTQTALKIFEASENAFHNGIIKRQLGAGYI